MPTKDREDPSEYPLIQTTKRGVRFVRPIDIIRSGAGLKILKHQIAENEKPRAEGATVANNASEGRPLVTTEEI
jgi:hypothetical protein